MSLLIAFAFSILLPLFALGNEWISGVEVNEIERPHDNSPPLISIVGRLLRPSVIEVDAERMIFGNRILYDAGASYQRQKREATPADPPSETADPTAIAQSAATAGAAAAPGDKSTSPEVAAASSGDKSASPEVAAASPGGTAESPAALPPAKEKPPRNDKIAADNLTKIDIGNGYPKLVKPNVTCITADDFKHRIRTFAAEYGVKKTKKCPKRLPCKEYLSCSIWRTGFVVAKTLKIDAIAATTFYTELFGNLHEQKAQEITHTLDECIKYYALDEPFVIRDPVHNDENENLEEGVGHEHLETNTKKHKLSRRRRDESGKETTQNVVVPAAKDSAAGGEPAPKDSAAGGKVSAAEQDPKFGLGDCKTRVEDFFECFDSVMLKGLCYWPPVEVA